MWLGLCFPEGMRLSSHAPSPDLAAYVRVIRILETDGEATRMLLPDTGMNLGLRYGGFAVELGSGSTLLPPATLAGLRRTPRRMYTSAHGGAVIVNFREGGAAAFFAEPLHELFGATIDLECMVPASTLDRVRAELVEAPSSEARVRVVERFLRARLRNDPGDPIVAAALRELAAASGTVRVESLARAFGLSADRFEKRFRQRVGAAPKQHASLLRFQRALALYRPDRRLTDLALDAGYFDQSHFSRDFRTFTGVAPHVFFKAKDFC